MKKFEFNLENVNIKEIFCSFERNFKDIEKILPKFKKNG